MQQMVWMNHSVSVGSRAIILLAREMEDNEFWTHLNQVDIGLDSAI